MRLLIAGGVFVEDFGERRRLGGSGLTAALVAARSGAEVSLASWVGRSEADEAFTLLDAVGVDRLGVIVLDGRTTTYKFADPADLSIPMPRLVQGAVPETPLPALPSAGVVLCFGTPGFDVIARRWIDRPSEGATLLFDRQGPQSQVVGARMAATVPAARRVLLANVNEARSEYAASDLAGVVSRLPPEGFEAALLKAGPWGATLLAPGGREVPIGTYAVTVRNAIGSGDVFAGTLGAGLSNGDDLPAAAAAAAAAAAVWITGAYDQPPADFGELVACMRAELPAVWVDRRGLEATGYVAQFVPKPDADIRHRITRGLRYLGLETDHARADADVLDLPTNGDDPVATALSAAIASIRRARGVEIADDRAV